MQNTQLGFYCPEGTRVTFVKPNGDTFTALIDGTVRIVNHVEVGERSGPFYSPDQMIGATVTLDSKAVKDEDDTFYRLRVGEQ